MSGQKLTKQEKSWIVEDVGNSALVMLATTLIPVYFATLGSGSVVVAWGYAETIGSLIVALLMPFLGSLADLQGNKKVSHQFVGTGAVACMCLGIPTEALPFLIVYVIAAVCLNSSMVFYDSFLVDATTDERIDKVSAFGYAWGYIGSCVPFITSMALVLARDAIGIDFTCAMRIAFIITALWWVAFTIPLVRNVHQMHYKERTPHLIKDAFFGLGRTMGNIVKDKRLLLFMLAFFFYIDGVHTIIKMATSYGTDLGIDLHADGAGASGHAVRGVSFGYRVRPHHAQGGYEEDAAHQRAGLYLHHLVRGVLPQKRRGVLDSCRVRGSVPRRHPSASRSEFGKLIPKDHSNEYYGFFDIFGKYAAVMGTALVSVFTQLTGNPSIGVMSIALLFAIGFVLLWKMPEATAAASE